MSQARTGKPACTWRCMKQRQQHMLRCQQMFRGPLCLCRRHTHPRAERHHQMLLSTSAARHAADPVLVPAIRLFVQQTMCPRHCRAVVHSVDRSGLTAQNTWLAMRHYSLILILNDLPDSCEITLSNVCMRACVCVNVCACVHACMRVRNFASVCVTSCSSEMHQRFCS